jgi:hypothetical protein
MAMIAKNQEWLVHAVPNGRLLTVPETANGLF